MMQRFGRAIRGLKPATILRWAGPAAIGFGVFLVFSAMSGMPINIPFVTAPNDGFEVVAGGLVLWAMILLLVGMVGLYARNTDPDAAKTLDWRDVEPLETADDLNEELRRMIETADRS